MAGKHKGTAERHRANRQHRSLRRDHRRTYSPGDSEESAAVGVSPGDNASEGPGAPHDHEDDAFEPVEEGDRQEPEDGQKHAVPEVGEVQRLFSGAENDLSLSRGARIWSTWGEPRAYDQSTSFSFV